MNICEYCKYHKIVTIKSKKRDGPDRLSWKGILPRCKPLDGKVKGAKVYSWLLRKRGPSGFLETKRQSSRPGLNQSLLHLEAGGKTQFWVGACRRSILTPFAATKLAREKRASTLARRSCRSCSPLGRSTARGCKLSYLSTGRRAERLKVSLTGTRYPRKFVATKMMEVACVSLTREYRLTRQFESQRVLRMSEGEWTRSEVKGMKGLVSYNVRWIHELSSCDSMTKRAIGHIFPAE